MVTFPDLPGAVTDGADETEALTEAADCLSEALATRISHGEEIPTASAAQPGQHLISPDPTIALKTALYMQLRQRDMTIADLADLLDIDWHLAARLIDLKRSSKLTSLAAALEALGCRIAISVETDAAPPLEPGEQRRLWKKYGRRDRNKDILDLLTNMVARSKQAAALSNLMVQLKELIDPELEPKDDAPRRERAAATTNQSPGRRRQ